MTRTLLQTRNVENPGFTNGLRDGESPERFARHDVLSNELARIGGLAWFPRKERTLPREKTAERFKSSYEAKYGDVGASDPAREMVDTSSRAHDSGMAQRIDAGESIVAAERYLGQDDMRLLVAVVVLEQSCSALAGNRYGKASQRVGNAFKAALDRLAHFWGY